MRINNIKRLGLITCIAFLVLFWIWPREEVVKVVKEPEIPEPHLAKKQPATKKIYRSTGSLTFKNGSFLLKNRKMKIASGAMHYFRVPEQYWEDRLRKMKECGLNTVETYELLYKN